MEVSDNESGAMASRLWVMSDRSRCLLHAPRVWDDPAGQGFLTAGRSVCGLTGWFALPDYKSRGEAVRCGRCCQLTGTPKGAGSPRG